MLTAVLPTGHADMPPPRSGGSSQSPDLLSCTAEDAGAEGAQSRYLQVLDQPLLLYMCLQSMDGRLAPQQTHAVAVSCWETRRPPLR